MSTPIRTKVFIVEDSPSIRDRLVELLGELESVAVVGQAATPSDAITGILRTHPDCVVLDYRLIGGTGIDVLRAVHPHWPAIAFVVLTNDPSPQHRRACLEAGASCFFDKSTEFGKIKEAITAFVPVRHQC